MRDINTVRRENLRLIEREAGGSSNAARLIGMSPAQFINLRAGAKDSKTGKPRGMRSATARTIEKAVGKPYGWMDTDHSTPELSHGLLPSQYRPILAWEHPNDLPEGQFVLVPRLDVRLSAGHGYEQCEVEFNSQQPQAFRAEWIRSQRLKPQRLVSVIAEGDSMEPRIQHGDALVIDTSQTNVTDGRVYALWYEGGERVKRLYRLPGGALKICSDNPDYPAIDVPHADLEYVRIIGRVVHIAGEGGL